VREEFAKIQNLNQKDKKRIILRSVVAKLEKKDGLLKRIISL